MVLKDDEVISQMLGNGYTSCIKINGVPILPPLITPERRLQLQNDKRRALELEKNIKCHGNIKSFIEPGCDTPKQHEAIQKDTRTCNRTLENFMSFGTDESHLDALNIPDISPKKTPWKDCRTLVPSKEPKSAELTWNIFDVTEYSDKGMVIYSEPRQLSASTVELDLSRVSGEETLPENSNRNILNFTGSSAEDNNECFSLLRATSLDAERKPKPRLLRSNSYTLDSPSPVLLEHFRKEAEKGSSSDYTEPTCQFLDLKGPNNCSATFNDVNACMTQETQYNSKETINEQKGCDLISLDNFELAVQDLAQKHFGSKYVSPKKTPQSLAINNKCNKTSPFTTTMTGCDVTPTKVQKGTPNKADNLSSRVVEAEAALQEVLKEMPPDYAKEILELLERHKKEQDIKLKSYAAFKQQLLDQNATATRLPHDSQNIPLYHDSTEPEKLDTAAPQSSEIKSYSNSQISPSDTLNLNTSTPLLIDFESESCDNEPYYEHNSSSTTSDPLCVLRGFDDYRCLAVNVQEMNTSNCSRELFPEKPEKIQRKLQEQWAAKVLTAAAKGYLVRRLKRTERVRNLIQTIQDALMCAMSLHMENTECINPPDVELHRRLIQQVSAACFEFYEVFFALTTKEQMALIALDRQRLQEKLKRPNSISSLKLDSNKSTPKSQKHSFGNMRQKKVLTPTFAA